MLVALFCFAVPHDDGGNLATERHDGTVVAPRFLSAYDNETFCMDSAIFEVDNG